MTKLLNGMKFNRQGLESGLKSVSIRYPDELAKIQAVYNREVTKDIIAETNESLK